LNESEIRLNQKEVCKKFKTSFCECSLDLKVGLSKGARDGLIPLNGLRHTPDQGTTGWYIYAGLEFSSDDGFFEPIHAAHLITSAPHLLQYLGLPPGWRFLLAENHEDIWFDESLL